MNFMLELFLEFFQYFQNSFSLVELEHIGYKPATVGREILEIFLKKCFRAWFVEDGSF